MSKSWAARLDNQQYQQPELNDTTTESSVKRGK